MNHIMATTTTTTTATGGKFPIPKPTPAQISQQQQQAALKCPRCDSSNTKFCYYNNYSLSQPRHFCKACKRYWTRGGTLRNVPVGGGCRKNKRIRRPNNSSSTTSFSSALNDNPPPSTSIMNPLFYGLPSNNNNDLNVQFTGYDQHHPMSGFGLGFSSGLVLNDEYQNGFTSNSQLSNYGSMFGSSPSAINTITTSSTSPTTMGNASFNFKPLFPYQNLQIGSSLNGGDQGHDEINGVKLEGDRQNRFGFGPTTGSINNQIHQIGLSADNNPSYLNNSNAYWSSDLSNIGSSVTSLI